MLRIFALVSICLSASGCMIYPYNGMWMASHYDPIPVTACLPYANGEVEIRVVKLPNLEDRTITKREETIATFRTGTTAWMHDEAISSPIGPTDWYCFDEQVNVPADLWEGVWGMPPYPIVTHYRTYFRVLYRLSDGGDLFDMNTYGNPPEQCLLPAGWSQITGDITGDTIPDFGAEYCALQSELVEVRGW